MPTPARAVAAPVAAPVVAAPPATSAPVPPAPTLTPSAEEEAIERRIARLARAAARDPKNGTSAPALYDMHSGLQAFCRGAGVEVERLPPDAQTRLLHLAGQLFREALVGLKELDRSRSDTRNRFRIDLPMEPDDPRPSLARSTVEDLVIDLFAQHESRRLDAVGWLREAIAEGKTHEVAAAKATRTAFVSSWIDWTGRARSPLRARRATRQSTLGGQGAVLGAVHNLLPESDRDAGRSSAHTFVEAFAAAYKEYVKKPLH